MLLDRARDLMKDAKIGYLATVEGDQPRVRAMSVRLTDDGRILTATGKESQKIGQAMENPKAEFCFVNAKWDQVRADGRLKIIEDQADKNWFWSAEPAVKDYFANSSDPNYVLLEFIPSEVELFEAKSGEFHRRQKV